MVEDTIRFAPPDDIHFQSLILRASRGQVHAYGVVIETNKVTLQRAFHSHRPEIMDGGQEIVERMFHEWQNGQCVQPWLYARDGCYIVSDDYFWLALIEQGKPDTFAAQILGEPLKDGLIQKIGPLEPKFIHDRFGQI